MRDDERELRNALDGKAEEALPPAPLTAIALRRIRIRQWIVGLSVGLAVAVVGVGILLGSQVVMSSGRDATSDDPPTVPSATRTPTPQESEQQSCPDIRLRPTYLPEGFDFQENPGPAPGAPPPSPPGQVIEHYLGSQGEAIEIRRPGTLFTELALPDDAPTIRVLGSETPNIGPVEPGGDLLIVQFTFPRHARPDSECALYSLNEYSLSRAELIRIARGLARE